ncbi:MAG: DUF1285 domain-containing protein [Pseudomonadales bacterium]
MPPVESWHPACCGDIDIRIARDGSWYHEGSVLRRDALIKLLSSILVGREWVMNIFWFLLEKMRIQVEDVPFLVVEMEGRSACCFLFRTTTDDVVRFYVEHPLRVRVDATSNEPRPYILVRGGMEARIHRPVFYETVELARRRNGQCIW